MTIVGKILVFLNFLFAGAVVYLIAQTFVTRENWKKAYEEMKNKALIAEGAYRQEKIAHENDNKIPKPQVEAEKRRADEAEKIKKFYEGDTTANPPVVGKYTEAVEMLKAREKQLNEVKTNHQALSSELVVLREERNVLIKQAEAERAAVLKLQKDINDEKRKTVEVTTDRDQYRQKAERMLTRVEELEKNVTTLTNTLNALGPQVGKSTSSLINPPPVPAPKDVYGTVRAVATSGITVISMGSDSGISAGNKLEVYRIDEKNPRNSVYLGELVISRTEPKQAVGQFYPKPFAKPEERLPRAEEPQRGIKGDIVSTGLGNK